MNTLDLPEFYAFFCNFMTESIERMSKSVIKELLKKVSNAFSWNVKTFLI